MQQLNMLMDYTKFHIGVYTTLCTVLVSVLGMDAFKDYAKPFRGFLVVTLILFVLAGMFGGIVGSAIPYYTDFDVFQKAKLGPWRSEWIQASTCMHLEHTLFWAGIVVSVFGVVWVSRPK